MKSAFNMGISYSPKKAVEALSKAFIKAICIQNGMDNESSEIAASVGSAAIFGGFSHQKKKLSPNTKLYKLIKHSLEQSFKNNGVRCKKAKYDEVITEVFPLDSLYDYLQENSPIYPISLKLESQFIGENYDECVHL